MAGLVALVAPASWASQGATASNYRVALCSNGGITSLHSALHHGSMVAPRAHLFSSSLHSLAKCPYLHTRVILKSDFDKINQILTGPVPRSGFQV